MLSLQTYDNASYDQLAWSEDCAGEGNGVSQHGVDDTENDENGNGKLIMDQSCPVIHGISPVAFPCSNIPCKTLPPPNYRCPLTLHLMAEPVVDSCGHCFDRDAITTWLQYHSFCPISRKPLSRSDLIPVKPLHERIQRWHMLHGSFDSFHDLSSRSESGSFSQLELMLLPQERMVLALVMSRKRELAKQKWLMQVLWCAAAIATVSLLLLVIYSYNIALRGPL